MARPTIDDAYLRAMRRLAAIVDKQLDLIQQLSEQIDHPSALHQHPGLSAARVEKIKAARAEAADASALSDKLLDEMLRGPKPAERWQLQRYDEKYGKDV